MPDSYIFYISDFSPYITCYCPLLQNFLIRDNNKIFCVVFVNGKFCKYLALVTINDFSFFGFNVSRNIVNKVRSNVTHLIIDKLLGLNTLSISLACLNFAPYDLNPPHTHLRNTKHLVVKDGTFLVGFVTSNPNKLFTKVLNKGYIFIFPIGLIHFQFNIGGGYCSCLCRS